MAAATASPEIVCLIAAAGKGTRLKADIPKAFVTLRGKSLVERSIRAMVTSGVVGRIVVLLSPDMMDYARELFTRRGVIDERGGLEGVPVDLVCGGGERADSVFAGLQHLQRTGATREYDPVVLVHDAARALTPPGMIARVARHVLQGASAVVPVIPVADTIKEVAQKRTEKDAGPATGLVVTSTPDRAALRAVQTPQGFRFSTLYRANLDYFASAQDFIATDDASLMEWAGFDVVCVPGDPMAFKVTTPIDLKLATIITDEAEPTVFDISGDISAPSQPTM